VLPVSSALRAATLAFMATAAVGLTGCQVVDEALRPAATPPSVSDAGEGADEPAPDPDEATPWGPTYGDLDRAEELVGEMDDAELAATVLMPGFWGYDGRSPSAEEAAANRTMHRAGSAAEALADRGYGGVFLRPEVIREATQVDALTDVLSGEGDGGSDEEPMPLLIAIDQEGGAVQRLQAGVDPVPSAQEVGATADPAYARQVARDNGRVLRELGVTVVFAPVADYDPTGGSALGSRTYSRDVQVNARLAVASMRGYLDAGVLPVVKHFPGIGTVSGDSHGALVHQRASADRLARRDLVAFRLAVDAGAPVVMTSHVAVDALDPRVAASVNSDVVEGLLRDDLGFEGVVVTDSQGMAPIHEPFGPGEGAVRSLLAGNDLVLNSPNPTRAWRHVRRAIASERLPRERVEEAATRVLALRLHLGRLQSQQATQGGR
jgi:beta-N-acetylhexosaminidase